MVAQEECACNVLNELLESLQLVCCRQGELAGIEAGTLHANMLKDAFVAHVCSLTART